MRGNRILPDETAIRKLNENHALRNTTLAHPEIRSKLIIIGQEINEVRKKGSLLREQHLQAMIERGATGDSSAPRSALKRIECEGRTRKSFRRIKRSTRKKKMTSRMRIDVPDEDTTTEEMWDKLKVKRVNPKEYH